MVKNMSEKTGNRPLTDEEKATWKKMATRLKAIDADKKMPLSSKLKAMKAELRKMTKKLGKTRGVKNDMEKSR